MIRSNADENVLKLVYYFVVYENYNPIIIRGNQNEIWLEKSDANYRIIRIASNYIHNFEQLNNDFDKVNYIVANIKRKALMWKVEMLNVFTNVNEEVEVTSEKNMLCINMKNIEDIYQNEAILKEFPNIIDKTNFKESGEQLVQKISNEIKKKNLQSAKQAKEIFKSEVPFVTYTIIAINVLVFLAMYLFGQGSMDTATLVNFGAAFRPFILEGQYFRLITSGFIHIGLLHLLFNNVALYFIGPQVENMFGKGRYLIIYFVTILFASLLSLLFIGDSISAGASGAIFGLLGALLYFGYHHRAYFGNAIFSQIIPLILINLMIGFSVSGINNAAHIGGLISGVMAAAAVGIKYKTNDFEQKNAIIMLVLFATFLIFIGFRG